MKAGIKNKLLTIVNTSPEPIYRRSTLQKGADNVPWHIVVLVSLGLHLIIILAELAAMALKGA